MAPDSQAPAEPAGPRRSRAGTAESTGSVYTAATGVSYVSDVPSKDTFPDSGVEIPGDYLEEDFGLSSDDGGSSAAASDSGAHDSRYVYSKKPIVPSKTFEITEETASDEENDSENSSYVDILSYDRNEHFAVNKYLTDRLTAALDASQLDPAIVIQARTSGLVNSKVREVRALQAQLRRRTEEIRILVATKAKTVKRVHSELRRASQRATKLAAKMQEYYPVEYSQAKDKVYNRKLDDDDSYM